MIAAGASLRHVLSHGTSYQQSWADGVGRPDALVLEAAPELLRFTDPDSNNEKLRTLRFSPRPIAANTAPHVYPRNAHPPAPFAPRTVRDILLGSALAAIEGWMRQSWQYICDCARLGVSTERGRIRTLVIPTDELLVPAARGTKWVCRNEPPVPADFNVRIESHLNLPRLGELLKDYPDQELVTFMTNIRSLSPL
jgi:hypothetical protein